MCKVKNLIFGSKGDIGDIELHWLGDRQEIEQDIILGRYKIIEGKAIKSVIN